MAAVGVGCKYEESVYVVPLLCVIINDGFEKEDLFCSNFVWEEWEEKRGCIFL